MTEWDLLSKMQELANRNASVPPAMAKVINNLNIFSSIIDPSAYTTCNCTVSAEDDSQPKYGCNNPYGDGSDPTYICSKYCDGKCKSQCCEDTKCKERYSLEDLG
jgi:hypothetical protein